MAARSTPDRKVGGSIPSRVSSFAFPCQMELEVEATLYAFCCARTSTNRHLDQQICFSCCRCQLEFGAILHRCLVFFCRRVSHLPTWIRVSLGLGDGSRSESLLWQSRQKNCEYLHGELSGKLVSVPSRFEILLRRFDHDAQQWLDDRQFLVGRVYSITSSNFLFHLHFLIAAFKLLFLKDSSCSI